MSDQFQLKDRLKTVIEVAGEKHYSVAIKKNPELHADLCAATAGFLDLSIPERVSVVLHSQSPVCELGNRRKFKNIKLGFVNCGRAGVCECARIAVSESCKTTLAERTEEDWQVINQKRSETVQEVYGVTNVSRVESIKEKRSNTIEQRFGVRSALSLEYFRVGGLRRKYGVDNPQELDWVRKQSSDTYHDRTGFDHPMHNPEIVEKCHANRDRTFLAERTSKSKLAISFENILSNLPDQIVPAFDLLQYKGIHDTKTHYKYEWKCTQCDLVFVRTMAHFDDLKCARCTPSCYQSQPERDMAEIIRSWGLQVTPSDRSIINPFELDLVIPERRVAIEYCGLYWHSESQGKTQTYHLQKLERCRNKGYRLITIFSDEWLKTRSIVESRLKSILGISERGVGARKLRIEPLPWVNAQIFLDEFHIQGAGAPVSYRYGAFDQNGALCAVMTFGKPRDSLELVRFSTDGKSYPGLASRLLRHFIRDYNPTEIISFADRRWSTGDLYEKLGFQFSGFSKPSYSYTNDYETREYKSHFRLEKLTKQFVEAREIGERKTMALLGYDRVWDCGNIKFIWKPDQESMKE